MEHRQSQAEILRGCKCHTDWTLDGRDKREISQVRKIKNIY